MRSASTIAGPAVVGAASPQRIRWGAVFGGAILGIALLAALTSLWFALAYASGVEEIRADLEWYLTGSAVASVFFAGLLAGWLSGVRGAGSGFFHGVTIWALMVTLIVSIGIPATFNVFNLGRVVELGRNGGLLDPNADTVLWATFSAIVGGLVASGLGGAIGGALTRPANIEPVDRGAPATADVDRPARPDVEEPTVVVVPEARTANERAVDEETTTRPATRVTP
jgi:hypothetical protein